MLTTSTTCGTTWTDRSRLDRAGVAADPGPLRAHDESGAVSVETDAKGVLRSVTAGRDLTPDQSV